MPKLRFIEQMLFGIAASQDCKLSQISRALQEPISLKKTEERLSHHLAEPELGSPSTGASGGAGGQPDRQRDLDCD